MSVGAGVAVNRPADPAGDAGQRLHAAEACRSRTIHEVLQHGPSRGANPHMPRFFGKHFNRGIRIAQDRARESCIACDQIAASADYGVRRVGIAQDVAGGGKRSIGRGVEQPARRAADPEAGVRGQRCIFGNLQAGDVAQAEKHGLLLGSLGKKTQ